MSNYLNFAVSDRDSLKSWIMSSLGYPLVNVEITEAQLDNCINDALEIYTKYIIQEEEYMAIDLEDFTSDGYQMPSNVTSVYSLTESSITSAGDPEQLFSVTNTMLRPMMSDIAFNKIGGTGWVDFVLAKQYLELSKQMTGGGYTYDYNPRTRYLKLLPDPVAKSQKGHIVVACSLIREDDQQMGEMWVKKYALACAKEKVGRVRKKYEGLALPGGGTLDTSIYDEGREDKEKLEEQLREENPTHYFMIG